MVCYRQFLSKLELKKFLSFLKINYFSYSINLGYLFFKKKIDSILIKNATLYEVGGDFITDEVRKLCEAIDTIFQKIFFPNFQFV
jgi:hypothetical protein